MKKLMIVAAGVASFCAWSAEPAKANAEAKANTETKTPVMEEKTDEAFTVGFDNDFFTAYTWRNAVATDRAVWQPCVWADWEFMEPFSVGFFVWQNWNLTKRTERYYQRAMGETDYNIHLGYNAWTSDDDKKSLSFEYGLEWYDYEAKKGCEAPSSNEMYLKGTFSNPIVDVYAQVSEAYRPVTAVHFETGLAKEIEITDRLSFNADWNVNFGSGKYLSYYLYDVGRHYDSEYDAYESCLKNGIGGTTIKGGLTYSVCDHFTIGLVLAYTAVLNRDARDGLQEMYSDYTMRNLVWGGIQAKIEF